MARNPKLCGVCHSAKKDPGYSTCSACREEKRDRDKREYDELKEKGICTRCRKEKSLPGYTVCETCRAKKADAMREKTASEKKDEDKIRQRIIEELLEKYELVPKIKRARSNIE